MKNQTTELNNPAIKEMLQLLSAALQPHETAFELDVSLWPEIKQELNAHALLPLVSDLVMNAGISEEDKIELTKATAANVRTFHKLMAAQAAVIGLLASEHISTAVMKGAAAAQYYARPELRQYGDIDMLVSPDDAQRAVELLCSSGYELLHEDDTADQRHIEFMTPKGLELELHRYFSSSAGEGQPLPLDAWLYGALKEVSCIRLNKYDVPVFPTLENGLILLEHIHQHLSTGLGLRQIIDWMLYVRAELTDDVWRESFRSRAETIGMDCLAKAVTKLCRKYLGLGAELTWCEDVDDDLVDRLMLHIIRKGNFGEKLDQSSRRTLFISHTLTHPVRLFSYLTAAGSIHMAEAGLRPRKAYAWLYQIGYLLDKTFRRESRGKLSKEIRSGVQEAELLKRLNITEN